uniref:G-protein coupled receptors family 1 profile domain-containing protein n=1 Tax=Coturnix japonica TaxID=93934 RepID=A0A8C2T432_COTJA
MSSVNSTGSSHAPTFFLLGIPGMEKEQFWIAFPFCIMYVIAVLGNIILLIVIKTESSLHEPMYLFLAMLAFTDLSSLYIPCCPKWLAIFWGFWEIGFIFLLFLSTSFSTVESGCAHGHGLDRYFAICHPLRHFQLPLHAGGGSSGSLVLLRAVLMVSPLCFLLRRKDFCHHRVISHSYCEHMAVVKLVCEDTRVNAAYGLFAAFAVTGFDLMGITLSYTMILRVVLKLSASNTQLKALNTCVSHVCVILTFYVSGLFTFLAHRIGHNIPQQIHILVANLYLLLPSVLNPIIYGLRTRQLRDKIVVFFQQRGIGFVSVSQMVLIIYW